MLEMSTFKKSGLFGKSKWRTQDGCQNEQSQAEKKDGKSSEELHDLEN